MWAVVFCCFLLPGTIKAGTWNDHFASAFLGSDWTGDRDAFRIQEGVLQGQSALPLGVSPLNLVELEVDSTECSVGCWINVVSPNLHVCTKGALVLRHSGSSGYVFALHEATQTIELYRLSTQEMLLRQAAKIELRKWYYVRADLHGPTMTFFVDDRLIGTVSDALNPSGAVGLAVQDAEAVWFDDFTIAGPKIVGNVDDVAMPQLTLVPQDNQTNVVFRFLATPPYDYFVQASAEPFGHDWQTMRTFRAELQSFEAEFSDPITNSLRYYRVEKVPCYCR
jgi:hypothetical protein